MKIARLTASLFLVCFLTSCGTREEGVSQSGEFLYRLTIQRNPQYHNYPVWVVTILDTSSRVLYTDTDSRFGSGQSVYLKWDHSDILWLYNGDDTRVWFWENVDGEWVKTYWGKARHRDIDREIAPPSELYPTHI